MGESSENLDQILGWFEERNIKKGNPEDIVEGYEKSQRKKVQS